MNATDIYGPVSTETIENERAAIFEAFAKGILTEKHDAAVTAHLDRLDAQTASIYDRTYWLALAEGRAECRAKIVARQAQEDEDFFLGRGER